MACAFARMSYSLRAFVFGATFAAEGAMGCDGAGGAEEIAFAAAGGDFKGGDDGRFSAVGGETFFAGGRERAFRAVFPEIMGVRPSYGIRMRTLSSIGCNSMPTSSVTSRTIRVMGGFAWNSEALKVVTGPKFTLTVCGGPCITKPGKSKMIRSGFSNRSVSGMAGAVVETSTFKDWLSVVTRLLLTVGVPAIAAAAES